MPAYLTPSPRIRRSPFFDATVREGVKGFSVYNHMYMPTTYGDPEAEYWRLIRGVAMWDVACQRQIEVKGPEAERLVQTLCPRKIDALHPGRGIYAPVCDHRGVLINDPVVLRLGEGRFWLSIADSDLLLWARAVAAERNMDVEVFEAEAAPMAVQGPRAIDVAVELFGDWVRRLRLFQFRHAELEGIPLVVMRAGWSKQGGFEFYLIDPTRGSDLWNLVREAGAAWDIGPGTPNPIERVESGLLSYGGDTDDNTNPFEVRLGRFVELDVPDHTIGIRALRLVAEKGPERHQLGIRLDAEERLPLQDQRPEVLRDATPVGRMTANAWSPRLEQNIGLCLVSVAVRPGDRVTVALPGGRRVEGELCELPFL